MFSGKRMTRAMLMASTACLVATSAVAQEGAQPAQDALPEVEVIQKKAAPAKKAPVAKKQYTPPPSPAPQPPPVEEVVQEAPSDPNSVYGSPASQGAQQRATQSAQTPVNPTQLVPTNLDGFSAAATNLSPNTIAQNRPANINEALTRVPGVSLITDDSAGHHGGIGVRGSPPRRSRKILVMEDGHANNLALWLDPSVHYWGPIERFESVEVVRGTVITHGPNNNFGVINARNLSPFGPAGTVVSGAIGVTRNERGSYNDELEVECIGPGNTDCEVEEEGDTTTKGDQNKMSYRWHVHTRQHAENVGLVLSYTGANVAGLWDTEQLRFNDFYGALGWKGSSSDVVVSVMHARQRDNYDEQNFLGEADLPGSVANEDEAEDVAEQVAGFAEQQFKLLKHCKSCFAPSAGLNTYNGDVWRGQIVHNAYLDDDTTITTRLYAQHHTRDRYQLNSYESEPDGSGGDPARFDGLDGDGDTLEREETIYFSENSMFGRLRTFRHIGAELRGEWANRNWFGIRQDFQAGVRYEYQDMTNRNFIGDDHEILKNGDKAGETIFDRELDANTVSAFLQTNLYVARDFNVVPGVRFEWYEVGRINRVVAREESEAGGAEAADCLANFQDADCLSVDGIIRDPNPSRESFDNFSALPGVAFAYTGLKRTTIFGGYHRGLSTQVLRNEDFPGKEETGDNFNLGLRSSAFRGIDFEVTGFYQLLQNYQYGASFSGVAGDRSFGTADEVEVSGVELNGRINSQPFTGGPLNFFGAANYTYSRGIFKDLSITEEDEDNPGTFETTVFNGNRIPESPLHVAALTVGVENRSGWHWDASVTWTYRGSFYTDESNKGYGFGFEPECDGPGECEIEEAGEDGMVPGIWLLSARFNLALGDSGASVWIAGDNLLDEFYISDREDGMKPGLGRTLWAGFKYQF